jgi:hypothetical protein
MNRLKSSITDLETYVQRSDRNRKASSKNLVPQSSDELKEKLLSAEIKLNDHDQKINFMLKSRKGGPPSKKNTAEEVQEETQAAP